MISCALPATANDQRAMTGGEMPGTSQQAHLTWLPSWSLVTISVRLPPVHSIHSPPAAHCVRVCLLIPAGILTNSNVLLS
jgi:hypothetical protein